ncbi:O-methyltransferase [Postechiella marina]
MVVQQIEINQINLVLNQLFNDSKNDRDIVNELFVNRAETSITPKDFKDVYLSISKKQGEYLVELIRDNNLKNIVEFGTSFGISTLFLAQGVLNTGGHIVTTELIESKVKRAIVNFKKAGVNNLIQVKTGHAIETLKNYNAPIDLLVLDGWKNLYLPLFKMLEHNFSSKTIVYVDNADMLESQTFLKIIKATGKYKLLPKFGGKVALIVTK